MADLVYINKDDKEKPALDFRTLLAEGITAVQQLAGDNWTDYNIHDPGVTILEQVCYALTELGYRANFRFEDLLASQFHPQNTNDTFFSAARILPSNPITVNDYRKLLIDRIDGLRNVWIEPLEVWDHPSQVRGTYLVFGEASPDTIADQAGIDRLKADIWDNLRKYGNLSEAFEQVIILDRIKMIVQAKIDISYEADVDEVHARVMYNLSRSMTRPMKFRSLESLMQGQADINTIFEGPRLYNGFILDSDLVKKITILTPTTFVTPIKDVPGVLHIRSINVGSTEAEDNPEQAKIMQKEAPGTGFVDVDKIPVFGNEIEVPGMIRYFKNNAEVIPDLANVKKIYEKLQGKADAKDLYAKSTSKINQQKVENSSDNPVAAQYNYRNSSSYDLPAPQGVQMDIGSYYSFQNHFPAIYGLGPMGIPAGLRTRKKEAILALKGYLMLFDQIMANYFAQLQQFSDLFSLDRDLQSTYFAGTISSLEKIKEMTCNIPNDKYESMVSFQIKFKSIVERALATIDDFNDRRNRFLDHLLARFGERTASYGFDHFNYYFSEQEHAREQIRIKTDLLAAVVKLSKNRARSFNYGKPYWGECNTSMMEWKVKILLGINTKSSYLAAQNSELLRYFHSSDPFQFGEVFAMMHAGRIEPLDSDITELSPSYEPGKINTDLVHKLRMDADMVRGMFRSGDLAVVEKRGFRHTSYLLLFRKEVDPTLFEGVHKELLQRMEQLFRDIKNTEARYWVPGREDNYVLEFNDSNGSGVYDTLSQRAWKEIGSFSTQEEAVMAGQMLYAHLRNLNLGSEGFYLVDHIHLRPRMNPEKYGIHFEDSLLKISVNSVQQFEFREVQKGAIQLLFMLKSLQKTPENIRYMPDKRLGMYQGNQLIARSTDTFENEDKAEVQRSNLIRFFEKLTISDFLDSGRVKAYKLYPEDFSGGDYSFRVTIVLPGWTPRFSNPEFRQILQNIFRLECPAHIGIDFKWLEFGEMLYFENLYAPWLDSLRNEHADTGRLNEQSANILQFLKNPDNTSNDAVAAYIRQALERGDHCCKCCNCTKNCSDCKPCTGCKNKY
ncbi:MAG: hypothetical protein ACT6QS_07565 [Flavobacteriales bacterium]